MLMIIISHDLMLIEAASLLLASAYCKFYTPPTFTLILLHLLAYHHHHRLQSMDTEERPAANMSVIFFFCTFYSICLRGLSLFVFYPEFLCISLALWFLHFGTLLLSSMQCLMKALNQKQEGIEQLQCHLRKKGLTVFFQQARPKNIMEQKKKGPLCQPKRHVDPPESRSTV